MRSFLAIAGLVAATSVLHGVDHDWQVGTWARPAPPPAAPARGANGASPARPPNYAIETNSVRLELLDPHPPAARRVVAARVGTPARFALEGDTVYVVIGGDIEYTLHVEKTLPRPQTAAATAAAAYNAFGPGHSLTSVTEGGKFVTLEDGSSWEVDPRGWYVSVEWQPQAGVVVRRAPEENGFNVEIQNLDVDEGVLARYVRR